MRSTRVSLMVMVVLVGTLLLACTTTKAVEPDPMAILYSSVCYADGEPMPIDAQYLLLYYAADWCPHCIEYGPQLKRSYAALKSLYGTSFELVFVGHGSDTGNDELLAFMQGGDYPFGYLPYEHRSATAVMEKVGESRFYIPGLLLIDRTGEVLSSSNGASIDDYERDRPIHVLQQLKIGDCITCRP